MKDLANKKLLKEWKKIETANIFSNLEEFADFYYANGEKSCFRIITSEPWSKENFFFGDYSELLNYYKNEFPKRRIGQKFHSLTILDVFYKNVNGKELLYAKCRCDCGNETEKLLEYILKGNARTCGCKEGQGKKDKATYITDINNEFIEKYTKELEEIGFTSIPAIKKNQEKIGYQKGYLSVAKIADMLHQDSAFGEKLRKAIHHHFSNDTKTEVDLETNTAQTRPFFFSRYYKKILYFIKESDFIPFLERYGDWLIKNGVNETLIYQLQGKEMPDTNELISFDMFADILKKRGLIAEKIISAIKQKHLHDTFMDLDENKKLVHKPVFRAIYDPTRKRFSYYFSSQKSMFAFLRKEKDLLEKFHIQTQTVDYLKQGLEIHPYNPNYIFVSQFSKLLHVHKTGFSDFIKANYLNETVTYQDTDGSLKTRPIFVLMQQTRKKNTHSYAIHPDDFNTFILKHQKELSVNPYALPFILNRQPIPTVGDRYLTLTELSQLLKITGPKIVSLILGFRKMADKILSKKILNSDNTPFFVYASKQKHNPGIYFDLEQLPLFLKTYRTDLINLGVLPQSISEAVFTQTTKPDYYLKFFINQRLKVKERQQRLLKKQEGRTYVD